MNQTAGVTNNVRCSGKGPKVRAAAGLRGARSPARTGLGGVRSGGAARLPPLPIPLLPFPEPGAESILLPAGPGSSPLRSPPAHHLAKFGISLPAGRGASSLQRCAGRAGIGSRAPPRVRCRGFNAFGLRLGEVSKRVFRNRGCCGLAAPSAGTVRAHAPASKGLKRLEGKDLCWCVTWDHLCVSCFCFLPRGVCRASVKKNK